jgi:hypothetical protein
MNYSQNLKSDEYFLYAGKGDSRIFDMTQQRVLYHIRGGISNLLNYVKSTDNEQNLITFYLNTIKIKAFFINNFNNGLFVNGNIRVTFESDDGKVTRKEIPSTKEMCLYRIESIKNTIKILQRFYKYQLNKEGIEI